MRVRRSPHRAGDGRTRHLSIMPLPPKARKAVSDQKCIEVCKRVRVEINDARPRSHGAFARPSKNLSLPPIRVKRWKGNGPEARKAR